MSNLYHLWETITKELSGVLDAHGVCALTAQRLSQFIDATVIMGLREESGVYYDVWYAEPTEEIYQERWPEQTNQIEVLIDIPETTVIPKHSQNPTSLLSNPLWQNASKEILIAPIPQGVSRRLTIEKGFLAIPDPSTDIPISADEISALIGLIMTFIDRALIHSKKAREEIIFSLTSEISQSLTSTLNLEEIFGQVSADMRRILDVESLSLGLIEEETQDIIFIPQLMGSMFLDIPPIRLAAGEGVAGWVASRNESVIVNDAYKDKRFFKGSDEQSGFETRSILCIPLQQDGQVIGIMEAINKRHGEFTRDDENLLNALSGPLTAAIINADLHNNVVSEKRRIETIFQSMAEGMITIDVNTGEITNINDAMLSLMHRERSEMIDKVAIESIRLKEGQDLEAFINDVIAHGSSRSEGEYPQITCEVHRDGEEFVPVLASGATVRNREDVLNEAIIVFSDLSLIREIERMRDDFFQGIIHELRTPLALILMYARLLLNGVTDEEKEKRFLNTIASESDRLQVMVRQMLQLAKLEAQNIQRSATEINLNEILDEILEPMADKAAEKGLTFIHSVQPDLSKITADYDTIYLIFKNLVDNAIKFTLDGCVRVVAKEENGIIDVVVRDEGIGIPEEAMGQLFKRFYRAKTAVERGIAGTGIGLYMVKEGVEKHRGILTVESKVGTGTTFNVNLPVDPNRVLKYPDKKKKRAQPIPA